MGVCGGEIDMKYKLLKPFKGIPAGTVFYCNGVPPCGWVHSKESSDISFTDREIELGLLGGVFEEVKEDEEEFPPLNPICKHCEVVKKSDIRTILINLTDVLGYNHSPQHTDAFNKALKELIKLYEL